MWYPGVGVEDTGLVLFSFKDPQVMADGFLNCLDSSTGPFIASLDKVNKFQRHRPMDPPPPGHQNVETCDGKIVGCLNPQPWALGTELGKLLDLTIFYPNVHLILASVDRFDRDIAVNPNENVYLRTFNHPSLSLDIVSA
jgi:hypothetical protein